MCNSNLCDQMITTCKPDLKHMFSHFTGFVTRFYNLNRGKRKEERGKRKEERGKRKEERGKRKEERGKRKEERGKRTLFVL